MMMIIIKAITYDFLLSAKIHDRSLVSIKCNPNNTAKMNYYSHFTDKATEAHWGELAYLRLCSEGELEFILISKSLMGKRVGCFGLNHLSNVISTSFYVCLWSVVFKPWVALEIMSAHSFTKEAVLPSVTGTS